VQQVGLFPPTLPSYRRLVGIAIIKVVNGKIAASPAVSGGNVSTSIMPSCHVNHIRAGQVWHFFFLRLCRLFRATLVSVLKNGGGQGWRQATPH
jgi:hypothetical protein